MESPATLGGPGAAVLARTLSGMLRMRIDARVAIDVRPLASGCELSLTSDANRAETTA